MHENAEVGTVYPVIAVIIESSMCSSTASNATREFMTSVATARYWECMSMITLTNYWRYALDHFMYLPLDAAKQQIRIFRLYQGPGFDDPTICQAHNPQARGDSPIYSALSYTWGDQEKSCEILCDGCPFQITSNLFVISGPIRCVSTKPVLARRVHRLRLCRRFTNRLRS